MVPWMQPESSGKTLFEDLFQGFDDLELVYRFFDVLIKIKIRVALLDFFKLKGCNNNDRGSVIAFREHFFSYSRQDLTNNIRTGLE